MNRHRPINVNPLSIRLPLPALVSITHRMSGILVFLLIPALLWGMQRSLASPEGLNQVRDCFLSPLGKVIVWFGLSGLIFHLLAGARHLLMDIHIGETLAGGRRSAQLVSVISFFLMLGAAYWVWR